MTTPEIVLRASLSAPEALPPAPPEDLSRVREAVEMIFTHKEEAKSRELNNTLNRFNPSIIGGDLLTVAMLVLSLITTIDPSLNTETMAFFTMGAGIAAGIINISVGAIAGKQAAQCALNNKGNGKSLQGLRYGFDFFSMTLLGAVMIFSSIATETPGLESVHHFFENHQYILPSAFFLAAAPTILEVGRRIKNIQTNQDLASQLGLNDVEKELNENGHQAAANMLMQKLGIRPESTPEEIRDAIEKLQEEMGVEAAIPVFKLLHTLIQEEKEGAQELIMQSKEEIGSWNNVQRARMFQQLLYTAAFILSMCLLSHHIGESELFEMTLASVGMMTLANIIPSFLDIRYPFKRNPHITVPCMTDEEMQKTADQALRRKRDHVYSSTPYNPFAKGPLQLFS